MARSLSLCGKENCANVRAVDLGMADGARLILHGLVVRRTHRLRCSEVRRGRVALEADRVHIGTVEQSRVRAPVREVTRRATLGFDYRVLINKWSSGFGVALRADRILL